MNDFHKLCIMSIVDKGEIASFETSTSNYQIKKVKPATEDDLESYAMVVINKRTGKKLTIIKDNLNGLCNIIASENLIRRRKI